MFRRWFHFNCRVSGLAAVLILLGSSGGCALWNKELWDLNNYRDDRAVDIDHRLQQTQPNVPNPF